MSAPQPAVVLIPKSDGKPRASRPRTRSRTTTTNLQGGAPSVVVMQPRSTSRTRSVSRARNTPRSKKSSDAFTEIINSITKMLEDPITIAFILVALVAIFTHLNDPAASLLSKWIKSLTDNPTTSSFGSWLKDNEPRLVGALLFIPVVISLPKKNKTMFIIAIAFWILFVPESSVWQYLLQAGLLRAYVTVPHKQTRLLIIAFAALMFFLGWLGPSNSSINVPTSTVRTTPKNSG